MASNRRSSLVTALALCSLLAPLNLCYAQGATTTPPATSNSTSALCPLTGKAPAKPEGSLPRCQSEAALACCSQCDVAISSLGTISKNGSAILGFLRSSDPDIASALASFQASIGKKPLCSLFEKNGQCLNLIEALSCAINCDAKAGTFLTVTANNGSMRICDGFAKQLYDACEGLKIPNLDQTIGENIATPQDLLTAIVDPLVASATPLVELTSTVVPSKQGKCYTGPTGNAYPTVNLCCDPLSSVPDSCFQGQGVSKMAASSSTDLKSLVNRQLPKECPAGPKGTQSLGSPTGANSKGALKTVSATSVLAALFAGVAGFLTLCV